MKPRGRLFRQYVIVLAGLVSGPLLASGALSVYLSYQQNKTALVSLQREKAGAAAAKIDRVLSNDPAMGVLRHVDAGYERADEVAAERGVTIPMARG